MKECVGESDRRSDKEQSSTGVGRRESTNLSCAIAGGMEGRTRKKISRLRFIYGVVHSALRANVRYRDPWHVTYVHSCHWRRSDHLSCRSTH